MIDLNARIFFTIGLDCCNSYSQKAFHNSCRYLKTVINLTILSKDKIMYYFTHPPQHLYFRRHHEHLQYVQKEQIDQNSSLYNQNTEMLLAGLP